MRLIWASIRHVTMIVMLTLLCIQTMTPAMAFERNEWLRYWTTVSEEDFTHLMSVNEADLDEEDFTIRLPVHREIITNKEFALRRLVREEVVAGKDLSQWTPVSEEVLEGMRGGFKDGPDGVFLSFGIERSVFRNGELVTSMTLNIPDLSKFAGNPADAFTLVQNGPGNKVQHDLSALPLFTTLIQNSLDNQKLQSETIINATVEALGLARSLERGNALSEAIVDALRH